MKDYIRNDTLYGRLLDAAGDDKLPVLDNKTFESMNAEYGKEEMRKNIADYIATERPVFPLKHISEDDMRDSFNALKNFNTNTICTPKEQVEKEVFEKYDDYEYSYDKYGLGLINGASTFNNVSNYFMQDLRLECGSYGFRAPKEVWENGDAYAIWKCLGPIWRGINDVKLTKVKDLDGNESEQLLGGKLDSKSYISAFRLGTYIATQFKPNVAKTIYDITNAGRVLDTSCGWGDRLAGFYASNATQYYGCDPNPNTYEQYMEQCVYYEELLGNGADVDERVDEKGRNYFTMSGRKFVKIYRCGAEDLPWEDITNIDCAFTSPPYFSTEEYNKGGEYEEDQSWFKFNEYNKWRDDFYLPVSKKSFNSLSSNGHLFINIMDPKVKNHRHKSCDELVDSMKEHFVGQIGMRIMQRPKSDKLFESEEAKQEFMNKTYIENVWCFSKKKIDYFREARTSVLPI